MRCGDRTFFREAGAVDDIVLAAYWLAHVFKQHPDSFLDLDPAAVFEHFADTQRLLKVMHNKG